jgi:hypothetical protein
LGQHRHKKKEGEEGEKKRNLKGLDVVRNCKECVFKPRILVLPFSVATKKLAHDHHKARQSVGPLKLVKVLL